MAHWSDKLTKMRCTITIDETADGKLLIMVKIPEGAEETVAGQLAARLLEGSQVIMNQITGQNADIQQAT